MKSRKNREESLRREAMKLRHQFAQGGQSVFSEVLSPETVASVIAEECGDYRERLYPPFVTLRLFIEQALAEDKACQDVVCRYLAERSACNAPANGLNTGHLLPSSGATAAEGARTALPGSGQFPRSASAQSVAMARAKTQAV